MYIYNCTSEKPQLKMSWGPEQTLPKKIYQMDNRYIEKDASVNKHQGKSK